MQQTKRCLVGRSPWRPFSCFFFILCFKDQEKKMTSKRGLLSESNSYCTHKAFCVPGHSPVQLVITFLWIAVTEGWDLPFGVYTVTLYAFFSLLLLTLSVNPASIDSFIHGSVVNYNNYIFPVCAMSLWMPQGWTTRTHRYTWRLSAQETSADELFPRSCDFIPSPAPSPVHMGVVMKSKKKWQVWHLSHLRVMSFHTHLLAPLKCVPDAFQLRFPGKWPKMGELLRMENIMEGF